MGNKQVKLNGNTVPPQHVSQEARNVIDSFKPIFYKSLGQEIFWKNLHQAVEDEINQGLYRAPRLEAQWSSASAPSLNRGSTEDDLAVEEVPESRDQLLDRAVTIVWGKNQSPSISTSISCNNSKSLRHLVISQTKDATDSSDDSSADDKPSGQSPKIENKKLREPGDISGKKPPPPPSPPARKSRTSTTYERASKLGSGSRASSSSEVSNHSGDMSSQRADCFKTLLTKDEFYELLPDSTFSVNRGSIHAAQSSSIEQPLPPGLHFHEIKPLTRQLCRGWMKKLGYKQENWKLRYFVALNEQDNYAIYYFKNDSYGMNPLKSKGCIEPCGYTVRLLNSEKEILEYGPNCLCLCDRYYRRTWYLQCSNVKELNTWYGVLQHACTHARPPLVNDEHLASAFLDSYHNLRTQLGFWGYYMIDRNEEDQLLLLAVEKIENGILSQFLDQVAVNDENGRLRKEIISQVFRIAGKQIRPRWHDLWTLAFASKEVLDKVCNENIGYIFSRQKKLYDLSARLLRDKTKGIMIRFIDSIAPSIAVALRIPVYLTMCEAITGFHKRCLAIIYSKVTDDTVRLFEREICCKQGDFADIFRFIRYFTRGEIIDLDDPYRGANYNEEAANVLREMPQPLPDLLEQLQGISLWEVELIIEDSTQQLVLSALGELLERIGDIEDTDHALKCLDEVLRETYHDAAIRFWWAISFIISSAVYNAVYPLLKSSEDIKYLLTYSSMNGRIGEFLTGEASFKKMDLFLKGRQRKHSLNGAEAGANTRTSEVGCSRQGFSEIPSRFDISDPFVDFSWALMDVLHASIDAKVFPGVRKKCAGQLRQLLERSKGAYTYHSSG